MKPSGIYITKKELSRLLAELETSGMLTSGGNPMGEPGRVCRELIAQYRMPNGSAISKKGEFYYPEGGGKHEQK